MPLPMVGQKNAQAKNHFKNVIAIAAGKGGVGKSTLTINLGLALQKRGFKVGILDGDIYGPSLRRMLIEDRLPSQKGEELFPALAGGMKLISMAYFRTEHQAASVRAPIANGIISQFIDQVQWGELDFLLVDFPPGTGDIQLTLSQKLNFNGAVMITTPQEVALQDVRKAIHLFEQVKIPLVGIVENMSYYDQMATKERVYLFGRGGGKRLAEEKGVPFLGEIPIDPLMSFKADQGKSIFDKEDEMVSATHFSDLTDHFLSHLDLLKKQQNQFSHLELNWNPLLAKNQADARVASSNKRNEALPLFILQMRQIDPYSFSIQWSDESEDVFNLNQLQKSCPCAQCTQSSNNLQKESSVQARRILTVGRYALKIEFTSGCSTGIYSYDYLRELANR